MFKLLCRGFAYSILPAVLWMALNSGPAVAAEPAQTDVTGTALPSAVIKPLDDPANPYAGQYQPWDYWMNEHILAKPAEPVATDYATAFDEALELMRQGNRPDWLTIGVRIDTQGFQVPSLVSIRGWHEALAKGQEDAFRANGVYLTAEGQIDPELRSQLDQAEEALQASFYPSIPAWLVEDLPHYAMLLPDSRVLTLGLLGWDASGQGYTEGVKDGVRLLYLGPFPNENLPYALYSSSGELMGTAADSWWYLVNPQLKDTIPGQFEVRRDGIAVFTSPDTGEVLSVWDWNGTSLGTALPQARDPHPFTFLTAAQIQKFYEATQAAK